MKPILFPKTATQFNTNGLGRLDFISCQVTEERNGIFELEGTIAETANHAKQIEAESIIVAKPSQGADLQAFRVYKITKPIGGQFMINARHISYQLCFITSMPFSVETSPGACPTALQGFITNAAGYTTQDFPFSFWTDVATVSSYKQTAPATIRSRLGGVEGSILDQFGGEYEWNNFQVKLHKNRGLVHPAVTLRYGKNIIDFNQEENIENTVTGIVPFWTDSEGGDIVTLTEKIVEVPNASSFPVKKTIPYDFSQSFEEKPTEAQLRARAQAYINTSDIGVPKVSIKLSFVNLADTEEFKEIAPLQSVNLCDNINVQFEKLGINTTAEIVKTEYDVLREKYNSIEIGSLRSSLMTTISGAMNEIDGVGEIITNNNIDIISEAKDYADGAASSAESAAKDYADGAASSAESAAKDYADGAASSAESAAKDYADGAASSAESAAKDYADGKARDAERAAKDYADGAASSAESAAKDYADGKARDAERAAKDYADGVASSAESAAKDYADGKASAAVNAANSYTDTKLNSYPTNNDLRQALDTATGWLTSADGKIMAKKDANGNWTELYFLSATATQNSGNVLRINENGIGFGRNGWGGAFTQAWTLDGKLVIGGTNVPELTVYTSDSISTRQILFKVSRDGITWNLTNSSMSQNGTLTIKNAFIDGGTLAVVDPNWTPPSPGDTPTDADYLFKVNGLGVIWNLTNSKMTANGTLTIKNAFIDGGTLAVVDPNWTPPSPGDTPTDADYLFKVNGLGVIWNLTNSKMTANGTLTIKNAFIDGGTLAVVDPSWIPVPPGAVPTDADYLFRVNSNGIIWNLSKSKMSADGKLTTNDIAITGGSFIIDNPNYGLDPDDPDYDMTLPDGNVPYLFRVSSGYGVIWNALYSSMSSEGEITAENANIKGTLLTGESNGKQIKLENGIISILSNGVECASISGDYNPNAQSNNRWLTINTDKFIKFEMGSGNVDITSGGNVTMDGHLNVHGYLYTKEDLVVDKTSTFRGAIHPVDSGGTSYTGVTGTYSIGGRSVHIVRGIIVSVT